MAKTSTSTAARKTSADTRVTPAKWDKPYPDFPLSFHPASGRLYKKIKGTRFYFGYAKDWQAALQKYQDERDDLFAGRTPRPKSEQGINVSELCDAFLNAKRRLLDSDELAPRTFGEYYACCEKMVDALGKRTPVDSLTADDFGRLRSSLAKGCGPVTLGNHIQRIRCVCKFAFDEGLITQPCRYGQSFNKPSKKTLRLAKAASGPKMFERDDVLSILKQLKSKPTMYAAVLLGLNAGFGAQDVASLPISAVDLKNGFVTFPRPKTGIERRAKLWLETVAALRKVLEARPQPLDPADSDLLFLTAKGKRWVRAIESDDPNKWTWRTDLIGNEFAKVMRKLKLNGRRGFYSLRHTHQTIAEGCRDFPAIRMVMGHADASISANYRERIEDDRLEIVALTVRQWLWPEGGAK